jgi:hypothetical protein
MVSRHAVGSARGAGFHPAGGKSDGEVGDEGVLVLAGGATRRHGGASASTVGLQRESRISLPMIRLISAMGYDS